MTDPDEHAPDPSPAPEDRSEPTSTTDAVPRRGGPRWATSGTQISMAPSMVADAPQTLYAGGAGATTVTPPEAADLYQARYARSGMTPLPFLGVAFAALAAAWWAVTWARDDAEGAAIVASDWWTNVASVLLPSEDLGAGAISEFRMWVALGLLVFAAFAVAVWIGRIGRNVRTGNNPFGSVLPILAFPAWWALPLTLGMSDRGQSHTDLVIRTLLVLALLLIQFVFVRWPLLNRIWRAGNLPYDVASIALWLPNLVPLAMVFASGAYTLISVGEDGDPRDSNWQPTEAMADWATWTTRVSALAILALLVVVSVRQHLGLRQDRADDLAARQR